jgi:LasA protease
MGLKSEGKNLILPASSNELVRPLLLIFLNHFGKMSSMTRKYYCWVLLIALWISACSPATKLPASLPTYDPFIPLTQSASLVPIEVSGQTSPTNTPTGPTPTRAPLSINLPPTPDPDLPIFTPTPDTPRQLPTPRQDKDRYVVQPGDTLGSIAQVFGISPELLLQANGIADPNLIAVDMTLIIPPPEPGAPGPSFKIIPDSELVYGPASALFNIHQFIMSQGGYLVNYSEEINGENLSADQILERVSQNYSINPRLLLAILEYQSRWVTDPTPINTDHPIGMLDTYHTGLYTQLTWAADTLNRGYYLWRVNAVSTWILMDGSVVPTDPTINAGTAAVQNLFAQLSSRSKWENDVKETGLFLTYWVLFGNPFNLAIEPLLPANLSQPRLSLPFEPSETWSFTGGPHGGWDSGSAWAALDFAPPGDTASCTPSTSWVTAIANGLILRAANGAVIQDLDNDGFEQTGWVILYMHIDSSDRVIPNTYLFTGEHIGHPSCEGGLANGTHVHIARRYNGEWIAADGPLPFILDDWISSGNGIEYDGLLTRSSQVVEAWDGATVQNQITH